MPTKKIAAIDAVLIGHLIITLPVLFILFGSMFITSILYLSLRIGFLIGCIFAWAYWSFTTPRWRHWAIQRGADPERLNKLGAITLLTFKKGSIFEKTEFDYTPKEDPTDREI